ncbi:MAG: DUF5715 family protein [Terriglobales bacterium]
MRAQFRTSLLLTIALLLTSSQAFAVHVRARYHHTSKRTTRHLLWTPVLRGSHDSLLRQNAEIDRMQLVRITNDQELQELVAREQLVPLPSDQTVAIDSRLEESRRYCRPWTRNFLRDLGQAYYKQFHQPIQVNSAVRTVEQQERLRRINHNAAPAEGEIASSHLAGLTVDIAKRGLNRKQRKFMEQYLVNLRNLGLVEAAEERRQACFHVMVSDRYTAWRESERLATAPHAEQALPSSSLNQQ